jgi:lysophospholipase L1-like esterase
MVVLGDSLAYGFGASREEHGLAHRIFAELRATRPGSTYANYAVPHSTMGDVLRHQVPQLHGIAADVVLLIAGANDLRYTRDRFVFARRFRHLLQAVHNVTLGATIVVGGMPDVTQTIGVPPLLKPAIARFCFRLNETMRRIVAEYGDCFIDLFAFTNAPLHAGAVYLCEDGYHPNDFGYAEISQRAFAAIAQRLAVALADEEEAL